MVCRSREGAWIEICSTAAATRQQRVAPARERGLKLQWGVYTIGTRNGRSREGAWIEIVILEKHFDNFVVAPARERGLK